MFVKTSKTEVDTMQRDIGVRFTGKLIEIILCNGTKISSAKSYY